MISQFTAAELCRFSVFRHGRELPQDGFISYIDGVNYISFSGANSFDDFDSGTNDADPIGGVHGGYFKAAGDAVPAILRLLEQGPIVLWGFSRGGGIAAILSGMAAGAGYESEGYAFGTPACLRAPPPNVQWWASHDDAMMARRNQQWSAHGYKYGANVTWLNGPRHRPFEYASAI